MGASDAVGDRDDDMNCDDILDDPGTSSKGEKQPNGPVLMDLDDDDMMDSMAIRDLGEEFLRSFCRKAAVSFFEQYGLISHQINSYNDFIKNGIQKVFDSTGEIIVEPGYDPSKKGDNEWKRASVKFGKVSLERPRFWLGEKLQLTVAKSTLICGPGMLAFRT
ncbi:DNA-directed RNA polymerase [Bertholletia excelsa]